MIRELNDWSYFMNTIIWYLNNYIMIIFFNDSSYYISKEKADTQK